jgi:hypothetical protein
MTIKHLDVWVSAAAISCAASGAVAQPMSVAYTQPALDRWMYPFNFSNGTETVAPIFAALQQPGFDDRDGEFLVGFDTDADIPAGQGRLSYKITQATLSVYVEDGDSFLYNPTPAPLASSYATNDPDYVPNPNPGWPTEVWAVGYRNGFSEATFLEDSPFGGTPLVPPAEGARNAYPALLDNYQNTTDMARQVRLKLPGVAMGIAKVYDSTGTEVIPGSLVPQAAEVRFELAGVTSENYVYLQNELNNGRVRLLVTTLSPTTGGPGGGTGGVTYPRFYTKENPVATTLGLAGHLTLQVAITCAADFNGDNYVDDSDFSIFVQAYNNLLDARCDLNGDGVTDDSDFSLFAVAYNALLCD